MPELDRFDDLPGLAGFGAALKEAARGAEQSPSRMSFARPSRSFVTTALLFIAIVGIAACGSVVALRASVIQGPDDSVLSADQRPTDDGRIATPRATDPAGGPPWALRLAKSAGGLVCTTVGQVKNGAFGIVGSDDVYRIIPATITDACGRGLLIGSRIVAAKTATATRSIIYGVAPHGVRKVVLSTAAGRRTLVTGSDGSFIAALRGYPEGDAVQIELTTTGGRVERYPLGKNPRLVTDFAGQPAWRLQRLELGTRQYCAQLLSARPSVTARPGNVSTPTACVSRQGRFDWVAAAKRLKPGDTGVRNPNPRPGRPMANNLFPQFLWFWGDHPARTVVWGVAKKTAGIKRVVVTGAGRPRNLTVTKNGTFAVILPASADPERIRLEVQLANGHVQNGRANVGLVPDLVFERRTR